MPKDPSTTDYGAVRAGLARGATLPREVIEDAYQRHVGVGLEIEQIEAFYKLLRKLAQRCDDAEFEAYVTRGEAPALVPLSPRELEVLQGAGRGIPALEHGALASFAEELARR